MKRALVIVALTLAACSSGEPGSRPADPGPPAGDDAALTAIREQGARWIAAAEVEDAAAIAEIYAEDALFLPPGQDPLRGRDTIRSLFEAQFGAMDAAYDFSIEELEVADDWAWRRGRYVVDARLANGDTLRADDKFVDIWRRGTDGRWRIAVDIWNANPEPEQGP